MKKYFSVRQIRAILHLAADDYFNPNTISKCVDEDVNLELIFMTSAVLLGKELKDANPGT